MNLNGTLFQLLHDLGHLGTELTLLIGACLLLILGLFRVRNGVIKAFVGLVLVAVWLHMSPAGEDLFGGMFQSSRLSISITKILIITSFGLLVFQTNKNRRSSYYFILLITLMGSIWLMNARHFLLIYLALEMVSYGGYLMTNFSFEKRAHEAGIKYLLFGGVCSAIMLFGISMIYGINGDLFLSALPESSHYAKMGAVLFTVGVLFKISAVPFHAWVPNVYESAPADAVAFFSVVPKLAGLVLLQNVLEVWGWLTLPIVVFGLLSILMGTLGALQQTNIRRLVSYGAIAHTGFLLPFVIWNLPVEGFVIYMALYSFMSISIFYMVGQYESQEMATLSSVAGTGKQVPIMGVSLLIVLLALIGLPPTLGFTSKWILFSGVWQQYQLDGNAWALIYLLTSVLATAVAVYYYLRPAYYSFMLEGDVRRIVIPSLKTVILILISIGIVGLFIYPELLDFLY
jgi:NADH-quinone oxidoreductase subunit N